MNLQQAKAELKKLADGAAHRISYSLTEHRSGRLEQECEVHVIRVGLFSAPTFREALDLLDAALNPIHTIKGNLKPQISVIESISDVPRTKVQQYIDLKAAQ